MSKRKVTLRSFFSNWPIALILLAILPACFVIVAFGWREYTASNKLRAMKKTWSGRGVTYSNETVQTWYNTTMHRGNAGEFSALLDVATGRWLNLQSYELPYLGEGEGLTAESYRQRNWTSAGRAKEFLEHFDPYLQSLRGLVGSPTPVWQPIAFNDFVTLLERSQNARALARILLIDADVAIYERDRERFVADIEAMHWLSKASDWRTCVVTELISNAIARTELFAIRKSIECGLWDDATEEFKQQLTMITELISQPRDVKSIWQVSMQNEMALALSSMETGDKLGLGPTGYIFKLPSVQADYIQLMESTMGRWSRGGEFLLSQRDSLVALEESISKRRMSALQSLAPAYCGFLNALINQEDERKLTLTAMGIQKFKNRIGRLPSTLNELTQVGMEYDDWHSIRCGEFGYAETDEARLLWGPMLRTQTSNSLDHSIPIDDEVLGFYWHWKTEQSSPRNESEASDTTDLDIPTENDAVAIMNEHVVDRDSIIVFPKPSNTN